MTIRDRTSSTMTDDAKVELVRHARKLRAFHNPDLPNGVGNTIDALCDALEQSDAVLPQEGWQPIEAAPKDGSTVLVVERTWGGDLVVTPAHYVEDGHGWWEHGSHPTDYADQPVDSPTHWRPLPEPPTITQGINP